MKSWQTKNNIVIHRLLSGRSNVFLIHYESIFMLVDTGGFLIFKKLKKRIHQIIGSGKLEYLFLTHSHFDHVKNASRLKEEFGCKIIIDENESKYLVSGRAPLPTGTGVLTKAVVWMGKHLTSLERYKPVKCDICIDDIYELKTRDDMIRMLRTPGHSIGSVSLVLDDEIALVGDSMYKFWRKPVIPPFADDVNEMLKSWGKILNTGCELYLPGHGRSIKRNEIESLLKKAKTGM